MLIAVYARNGIKSIEKQVRELLAKQYERVIIIGDWNARLGTLGGSGGRQRSTRDQVINEEGRKWILLLEEFGLMLFNGNVEGNLQGEYTHDGPHKPSDIDYACATPVVGNEIATFRVESRTDSDHQPITISWGQEPVKQEPSNRFRRDWRPSAISIYKEKISHQNFVINGGNWEQTAEKIKSCTVKRKINPNNERRWFDKVCWEERKKTTEALKQARIFPHRREEYVHQRKRYKLILKDRKRQAEEQYIQSIESVKNMNEAWSFINKERKKRKRPQNETQNKLWSNTL